MSLAIVFATIDRPYAVQRIIHSVRHYFENMPIYIADQSQPTPQMVEFYDKYGVTVVWMGHDSGVCMSRNAAVQQVKEDYFVLCDDDFIFSEATKFDDALKVLTVSNDVGVVGGRLEDVTFTADGFSRHNRFWELYFQYDKKNKLLVTVPIHMLAPKSEVVSGVKYYLCDAVMNFAVFRKSIFTDVIKWDPRFKSNGEHEDFYLNLKLHGQHKVAYLPSMYAEHHHPPSAGYASMRDRNHGWRLLMEKWGLEQHLELGLGLRTVADVDTLYSPETFSRASFFKSPDGAYATEGSQRSGLFSVASCGSLLPDNYYDETGNSLVPTSKKYISAELGPKGDVCSTGGVWRTEKHYKLHQRTDIKDSLVSSKDGVVMFVKHRAVVQQGRDFIIYAKPLNIEIDQDIRKSVFLTVSWRLQNDYLIFNERVHGYRQAVRAGEWNALNIGIPRIRGLWSFELNLCGLKPNDCALLATGDVAVVPELMADYEDLWVNAWSPARPLKQHGSNMVRDYVGVSNADSGDLMASVLSDVCIEEFRLNLITISNRVSVDYFNPSLLTFDRFPFAYGAGRSVCESITAPGVNAKYLIPVSDSDIICHDYLTIDGVRYSLSLNCAY